MKPTYGRVSRRGVLPLSYSLDHVGPMTRTVTDNALLLGAISGYDPQDAGSSRDAVPDFAADLEAGVSGLRVGVIRRFYRDDFDADAEMVQGIEDALSTLAALGAQIREIDPGPLADYSSANRVILLSEAYAIHEKWLQERPADYGGLTRQRLLPGAFFRAVDYVQALRQREILRRRARGLHGIGRRGRYRLEHGTRLSDRGCGALRETLRAAGARAVQSVRFPGPRRAHRFRLHGPAAVHADHRPARRRGDGVPRRPRVRAGNGMDLQASRIGMRPWAIVV